GGRWERPFGQTQPGASLRPGRRLVRPGPARRLSVARPRRLHPQDDPLAEAGMAHGHSRHRRRDCGPTMTAGEKWAGEQRLGGLRRFAVAITVLNILGHTVLGFEQSWAQPLIAVATAYATELLIETMEAWLHGRRPRFAHGPRGLVDFLLSAH